MSWTIESIREADVEPDAVFALYADPATWSRWGHNATWAHADGPLADGGIVDVRDTVRSTTAGSVASSLGMRSSWSSGPR